METISLNGALSLQENNSNLEAQVQNFSFLENGMTSTVLTFNHLQE
jgi:hypothetical protein